MTLQTLTRTTQKPLDIEDAELFNATGIVTLEHEISPAESDRRARHTSKAAARAATRRYLSNRDELGRLVLESALGDERASFALECRSTSIATSFATPMRSLLLTLTSGFGGTSVTVSPSLLLHTYPAMQALVSEVEDSGAAGLWQPIGERSLSIGKARHVFVSADHPVRDDAHRFTPNVMVEVVGAHLIPSEWFEKVVVPRCSHAQLTLVFYGQRGAKGSIFERAWEECRTYGSIS